jgi:hypothetical protein
MRSALTGGILARDFHCDALYPPRPGCDGNDQSGPFGTMVGLIMPIARLTIVVDERAEAGRELKCAALSEGASGDGERRPPFLLARLA